ncbi:unnamed protein product [Prorocentrum cordatum]|uniref:Uncharacterized protein n=1 Tax=Prorocentrum cordatum TaxID=2364126 RepID=A0ABN9TT15_9DINO|nr:unnamed protein product [Polarella glacialis]
MVVCDPCPRTVRLAAHGPQWSPATASVSAARAHPLCGTAAALAADVVPQCRPALRWGSLAPPRPSALGAGPGEGRRRWPRPSRFRLPELGPERRARLLAALKVASPFLTVGALCLSSWVRGRQQRTIKEVALSAFFDFLQNPTQPVRHAILGSSSCTVLLEDGTRLFARWPAMAGPVVEELWSILRGSKIVVLAERTSGSPKLLMSFLLMGAYRICS